jgi:predicted DNA binding CopG/RHH family protein
MARPKKEETLTKVQVRLSNKVIKTLQSESKKSGMNLSQVIRTILEKNLNDELPILGGV